jgi:uncharacterized protein YkwD
MGAVFRYSLSVTFLFVSSVPINAQKEIPEPAAELELEVHNLINAERDKKGRNPLESNAFLDSLARQHSSHLASGTPLGHLGFSKRYRLISKQFPVKGVGENEAEGYSTAAEVVEGWMSSKEHRKNILYSRFTHTGVGVVKKGATFYYTQIFCNIISKNS